jgi:IS1 family transposase
MGNLSSDQRSFIITALCEGNSIRSTARLTGCHRDTIMRLGLEIGNGCEKLHQRLMTNLRVSRIELDEVWSFVKKKKQNVRETDPDTVGDQFIYIAMDSIGKAILSWHIGKRTMVNTMQFVAGVRCRVLGNPEISTDGFRPYVRAVDDAFQGAAAHGVVDKQVVIIAKDADKGKYYARETLVKIERSALSGTPSQISTSYIERQNLTLRMSQRRMTRLTNGFSKKLENHRAAFALYAMHYNFCRVHEALKITPAMHLGVTDHVWNVSELVQAVTAGNVTWRPRVVAVDGNII